MIEQRRFGTRTWVILALGLAFLCTACLRPVDSDFEEQGPGLEDDEMLWIIHIPDAPSAMESLPLGADSASFEERQEAIFKEALPALIEDVLNGAITAYAEYGDVKPAKDLREKLQQFGGTKLNYAPLKRGVELFSIVRVNEPTYLSRPCFLSLVWKDPSSAQSDRSFAGVYVDSLPRTKYMVNTTRGPVPLRDYLRTEWFYYEPIYIRTNALEYAPRSREEAIYLREKVKKATWRSLDWVEGSLNLSGKHRISMASEDVLPFAGVYMVGKDGESAAQEVFFYAENDYLVAEWEEKREPETIFPFHKNGFFSTSGDIYIFKQGNGKPKGLYVFSRGDTLVGNRYSN